VFAPASLRVGARSKGIQITTRFRESIRLPIWIAGIAAGLLAAAGIAMVAHWIPASYANVPRASALFGEGMASTDSADPHSPDAPMRPPVERNANSRHPMWCPGCGVVESMRKIESPSGAAAAVASTRYEYTVRFRDGSTTVFNEATPRSWRMGNRVIVIDGSHAAAN